MENTNLTSNTNTTDISIYQNGNLKEIAIELHHQGFNIIPLGGFEETIPDWFHKKYSDKNEQEIRESWCKTPRVKLIPLRSQPADTELIERWWDENPNTNIGIITENLVVIDADNAAMVEWCIDNTDSPYRVKTSKGYHFYFAANPEIDIRNSADTNLKLDIRAQGGYVVTAGSTHGSGVQYQLELQSDTFKTVDDLPVMTPEIWEKVQGLLHPETDTGHNKPSGETTSMVPVTEDHPEHGYNNHLTRLVGKWIYEGLCESQLHEKAIEWDSRANDPMGSALVDKLVSSVIKTHKRKNPDKPVPIEPIDTQIAELNRNHFVVPVGKKVKIAFLSSQCDSSKPKLLCQSQEDFKLLYSNRTVNTGDNKFQRLGNYWLHHSDRRKHDGIVFIPTDKDTGRFYNLWNGFNIDEVKLKKVTDSDCKLWLDFIYKVICSCDNKLYSYVLNWMAHLVQFPEDKNGVALVLKSEEQGTGKTFFVEHYGSLLGEHFYTVSDPKFLTGSFNAHMEYNLLCGVEEAVWSGDVKTQNLMKDMITGKTRPIESKGKDVETGRPNYSRFIFTSNQDHAVAIERTDRRFQVIKVSTEHQNDVPYFKSIDQEWNNGGKEALFQFLQSRSLDDYNFINERIVNDETLEQKRLTWSNEDKWLFQLLYEGGIPNNVDSDGFAFEYEQQNVIPSDIAFHSYLEYMKNARKQGKLDKRELSTAIKKRIPNMLSKQMGSGVNRRVFWVFPSLKDCREHWDAKEGEKTSWISEELSGETSLEGMF